MISGSRGGFVMSSMRMRWSMPEPLGRTDMRATATRVNTLGTGELLVIEDPATLQSSAGAAENDHWELLGVVLPGEHRRTEQQHGVIECGAFALLDRVEFAGDVIPDAPLQTLANELFIQALNPANGALADADATAGPWNVAVGECTPLSHASYRCDDGDVYWFDGCGYREQVKDHCGGVGCEQDTCLATGPCPNEMVQIGSQPVCIDRYEATVFENADCTGTRYGEHET